MKKSISFLLMTLLLLMMTGVSVAIAETFGSYQGESIEWVVLEQFDDGTSLLISKTGIDAQHFDDEKSEVLWEDCTLRAWLNGEFLETAFTPEEQERIIPNVLDDKVTLLSKEEVEKYFPVEKDRISGATAYALTKDLQDMRGKSPWWTRSAPGEWNKSAWAISAFDGGFTSLAIVNPKGRPFGAVRPVILVK